LIATTLSLGLTKRQVLFQWLRLFAGYSAVQMVAQGLGFLAGIILLRSLSKEDYACFMIVNTIGPTINLLSDSGITSSLVAIGGTFWQDDLRLGSLVKTALELRRRLVWLSFFTVAPMLVWILRRNHVTFSTIAWVVPITFIGVFCQLNVGVLSVVINLRQQVGRMQLLLFSGVVPRLILISLLGALGMLNAPLAVAAGTLALASQFWLLDHWVSPQIPAGALPSADLRTKIISVVKRQAPLTIYFCAQGQIGIWLISIFGNVHGVAEVGALGRIGMIFTILVSAISALIVPRFARSQEHCHLRSRYLLILLGFISVLILSTFWAWLFPSSFLWMLGARYAQLGDLLWLAILGGGNSALGGLLYTLNVNKGWIPPAAVVVPVDIVNQFLLCLVFDLSSVRGILLIGVIAPVLPALINLVFGLRKMNSLTAGTPAQ
jgi:hypothetical protein